MENKFTKMKNEQNAIHDLKYEMSFIDVLSSISNINDEVIIKKSEDKKFINIKGNDDKTHILYTIDAPVKYFNFKGDEMGIISFKKMNQYLNTYITKESQPFIKTSQDIDGQPEYIYINSSTIQSKITHKLGFIDVMRKPCFKSISPGNKDTAIKLSIGQIQQLKKMTNLIEASDIKFIVNGDICNIALSNPKRYDNFEQSYPNEVEAQTPFKITVLPTGIELMPVANYEVNIDKEGLVHFHQIREDEMDINFYLMERA